MQDECNALELELKHHEKGFAELVSQELEQRFVRFEEVTLAAVQKMVSIIAAPAAGSAGEAGVQQLPCPICPALLVACLRMRMHFALGVVPAAHMPLHTAAIAALD